MMNWKRDGIADRFINSNGNSISNGETMKLKCRCGKEWDYQGKNKYKVICPDCRGIVKIKETR